VVLSSGIMFLKRLVQ